MKRKDFLNNFIETLEIENKIDENTSLDDISEWDSLASVTTLAMFKKFMGLSIGASDIKRCASVKDILDLGNGKYE